MSALDDVSTRSIEGFGCGSLSDGDCPGNLSLGQYTGDGKFDGKTSKQPWVYVIYYMLISGGFAAACLQAITKGVLHPRLPWTDTCLFRFRQTVDLVHTSNTVKGMLFLVPPRTPRSSGYDVYAHVVYVVICYMSVICICLLYVLVCYMSVICCVCYMSSSRVLLLYVYVCYMSVIC
jgi:hypothetical protein